MGDSKNIFLAIGLSLLVMVGYDTFYLQPKYEAAKQAAGTQQVASQSAIPTLDGTAATPSIGNESLKSIKNIGDALASSDRVIIETPELSGSILLKGLRFDDLLLNNHFDILDKATRKNIRLFEPVGTEKAYYAQFGWAAAGSNSNAVPTSKSVWTPDGTTLTPSTPITFSWDNGLGLRFMTKISIDDHFMFEVEQSIINQSGGDLAVAPYGLISRLTIPETSQMAILHEGPLGVFNGEKEEVTYGDLEDETFTKKSVGGWLGITDKYWMSVMVPSNNASLREAGFKRKGSGTPRHDASYIEDTIIVPAGSSVSNVAHLFAGAKKVNLIDDYAAQYNIEMFDRTIDWGWLYWITRPMFFVLDYLFALTGNFGVAILLITVVIKLILFPIANKGYRSMSRMKKVNPKIKALQARYKDDKPKLQQETMALYKKEKINPLSGCLPMVVQIPVFFALYKVVFVAIDMRHQPFFGWIKDLSAPDPMTPLNLFGLIPWDPPSMIAIGIWPIIMGLTMWFQQKLNPQTMEPAQAKVMAMLPIVFTFILANFSAGLVIYWTWNSILSIGQQWFIMKREGVAIND